MNKKDIIPDLSRLESGENGANGDGERERKSSNKIITSNADCHGENKQC